MKHRRTIDAEEESLTVAISRYPPFAEAKSHAQAKSPAAAKSNAAGGGRRAEEGRGAV